ncbi:MAG: hypothetical protein COU35_03135 [Candidatus Magasanikbacteria bacterium CG10_big_fil_rev_8_21_14_0_10_47_10]|uniref:Xaa-Pro dipeptidase n=1 Tax=Candidatus Magasanikbacteria bacterium CG10_big_fil_rev_8_21_14_0_10_47_10 TaxID=1974652 RepID=A0A2H0TQ32_9BACT|nr:MAG: hypothetical protein COU35_03135 [Candidatus Magasanikbacteria bacterium CG10_big_fil_rev_8_21_14_0_10_47_10]
MTDTMYQNRIKKLREILDEKNTQAILVTNATNIFYLTGFIGISPTDRESALLVTNEIAYLFVPKMYEQKARNLALETSGVKRIVDHERHSLLTHFCEFVDNAKPVLCEALDLTISEYKNIEEKTKITLLPESGAIERLRLTKDADEIEALAQAVTITERIFEDVVEVLRRVDDISELSELDIVDSMRALGRHYGADGFGFDPIVALGANAAEPHYVSGNAQLKTKNCLLLDFGFAYNGYSADLTRTIFLGRADDEFKRVYELVQRANEQCIAAAMPGVSTKDLHRLSVDIFSKEGLSKHYLHSLGHGLGLNVHETPSVGPGQDSILESGMVITIEPGLYFAKKFGVRIEDDILITDTGNTPLTRSNRNLVEIV